MIKILKSIDSSFLPIISVFSVLAIAFFTFWYHFNAAFMSVGAY